jgi:hypothetical protein
MTAAIINAIWRLKHRARFLLVDGSGVEFKVGHRCFRARWDHEKHTIYVVSIREKYKYQVGEFDEYAKQMMESLNKVK